MTSNRDAHYYCEELTSPRSLESCAVQMWGCAGMLSNSWLCLLPTTTLKHGFLQCLLLLVQA